MFQSFPPWNLSGLSSHCRYIKRGRKIRSIRKEQLLDGLHTSGTHQYSSKIKDFQMLIGGCAGDGPCEQLIGCGRACGAACGADDPGELGCGGECASTVGQQHAAPLQGLAQQQPPPAHPQGVPVTLSSFLPTKPSIPNKTSCEGLGS